MAYTFCVDFGSTFTKLCVFDLENGELVMTTKRPTTVGKDAGIALLADFEDAKKYVGEKGVKNARILTSSSAAGGLRMAVVGLTKRFSLLAGKNTALGAGARVIRTFENRLTEEEIRQIERINPEIILLCGGIEGGNTRRILYNVSMLKKAEISSYVVYAGNCEIAPFVRQELLSSGIKCYIADNVFPEAGEVNAASAGNIIRQLFMERIAGAKGLAPAFKMIGSVLMPTPAAVLAGGKLLAQGTGNIKGLSDMMLFDVGGATTDVYSFGDVVEREGKHVGAPEPFAKRTVEGDLGVRSSCLSMVEALDTAEEARRLGIAEEKLIEACRMRAEYGTYVADNEFQRSVDYFLAGKAIQISARRHCGKIVNAYAKNTVEITEGKDLTKVRTVVGTGGPVIHSRTPAEVLSMALRRSAEKTLLLPENAEFYLDRSYIMYAAGLCADIAPDSALHILENNIIQVN